MDAQGTLWFTTQSGHVGQLVPQTEEMTTSATPTSGAYPYGIPVNPPGRALARRLSRQPGRQQDPQTVEITEYALPHPDSRPRRIALTPDDAVWYTDYPRSYLGRFDPQTGGVRGWPSPGGPDSRPYGIAAVGEVIWYVETLARPYTLVRFDTRAERFQTWLIPSGGGAIRHMMAAPDGDLMLA